MQHTLLVFIKSHNALGGVGVLGAVAAERYDSRVLIICERALYCVVKDSYDLCVQELEEGAVLLKNDNNALPLNASERKVSLFGSHSANIIYRSGAGGPAPNDQ
mgnify:CR=1 FL=1